MSIGLLAVVLAARGRDGKGTEDLTTGTTGGPPPAAVLAAAPAASRAGGTARVRTTMRGMEDGEPLNEKVEGVIAFDTSAFDLTYVVAPEVWDVMAFDDRAFSDGTTVWMPLPSDPDFLAEAPASVKRVLKGKKYLSFELESDDEQFVDTMLAAHHGLGFSIGNKPGDVLSYLTSVGTAVREGSERFGSEDVDRYGVELDLDALQRALPSEERTFDAYDFKADVPHTFPGKVWLDREGRLRKLTYRLDLAGLLTDVALRKDYLIAECPEPDPALERRLAAGDSRAFAQVEDLMAQCTDRPARPEELVIEGSVELSDYGVPLTVAPPPAAEVLDGEKFDEALFSSTGYLPEPPPTTRAAPATVPPRTATTKARTSSPTTARTRSTTTLRTTTSRRA